VRERLIINAAGAATINQSVCRCISQMATNQLALHTYELAIIRMPHSLHECIYITLL
jgi:hypothetical protein